MIDHAKPLSESYLKELEDSVRTHTQHRYEHDYVPHVGITDVTWERFRHPQADSGDKEVER